MARTDTLSLNATLSRMHLKDEPQCMLCNKNTPETIEHFFFECTAYTDIRNATFLCVQEFFTMSVYDLDFTELSPLSKLQYLIGDFGYYVDENMGRFFDRVGKNMLRDCYVKRNELLNLFI